MEALLVVSCLYAGATYYQVPIDTLLGILQQEGGRSGRESAENKNGTRDLGLWQINTHWLREFAKAWGVSEEEARSRIRDDGCTNAVTAAYVLRTKINAAGGDLKKGIQWYNSANPAYGVPYREKVERHIQNLQANRAGTSAGQVTNGRK